MDIKWATFNPVIVGKLPNSYFLQVQIYNYNIISDTILMNYELNSINTELSN